MIDFLKVFKIDSKIVIGIKNGPKSSISPETHPKNLPLFKIDSRIWLCSKFVSRKCDTSQIGHILEITRSFPMILHRRRLTGSVVFMRIIMNHAKKKLPKIFLVIPLTLYAVALKVRIEILCTKF